MDIQLVPQTTEGVRFPDVYEISITFTSPNKFWGFISFNKSFCEVLSYLVSLRLMIIVLWIISKIILKMIAMSHPDSKLNPEF